MNKRKLIFITCIYFITPIQTAIAGLLTNNPNDYTSISYFAHMPFRETPYADLRGIYPISADQAKNYNHFRFVYDDLGRPIEVSFRFGEQVRPLNISRNSQTFAPVTKISYEDGKETRTYYDAFMNRITSNGSFRDVFVLDVDGNRVSLHFFDVDGEAIKSKWGIFNYEWSVDRRGTVTENRFDKGGKPVEIRPHFPFYCLKLHYDQRGFLAMMENYGNSCEELVDNELNAAQDKLQYGALGGMYAWNVYNAKEKRSIGNGPMVARGIMKRDKMGHTVREYYEDTDGEIMTSAYGWTNTTAAFDKYGNMIERSNRDANGHPLNNPKVGYSGAYMEYDDTGKYRKYIRLVNADGSAGKHIQRGYHAVRIEYNSGGNPIRVTYEDANGNLVNRADNCVAMMQHSYDDKNRRSITKLYDANQKPTRHCTADWHETIYHYHKVGPLSQTERN